MPRKPTTTLLCGDAARTLRDVPRNSIHCIITSPPYWGVREYGDSPHEMGREDTPEAYVANLVRICTVLHNRLRADGTLWLNIGVVYTQKKATHGYPTKSLIPTPWMTAMALQQAGWYLRADIIWAKPNPMPESVEDRPTRSHEYVFLLSKRPTYFYDRFAIMEPTTDASQHTRKTPAVFGGAAKADGYGTRLASGNPSSAYTLRNKRDVWLLSTQSYRGAHFAAFPERLVEPCLLAGTSAAGCCPHCGAPLTRVVDRTRRPTRPGETTKVTGAPLTRISHDPAHRSEWRGKPAAAAVGNRDPLRHVTDYVERGWQPTCTHEFTLDSAVPCTVLDPFMGSGTVGVVAARHGRSFLGIDLEPSYVELATHRIQTSKEKNGRTKP